MVTTVNSHAARVKYPLPAPLRRAASPGASSFGDSRLEGSAIPQATITSLRKTFKERFNERFNTSLSRSVRYTVADPPPALLGILLGASDKGLHTPDGDFDVNMGVECNRGSSKLLGETGETGTNMSVRRCREACAARVECVAAELDQVLGKCMLWRECLYREPAMRSVGVGQGGGDADVWGKRRATSGVRVMHRVGRPWPVPAGQVVWRANATIVVASYTYRLDWLRTIPSAFDVALYHKHDFVASPSGRARTMSDERLPLHFMRDRPQPCFNFRSVTHPRVGFPLEPCRPDQCNCSAGRNDDHRLAYYRVLPNYGRTDGKIRANGDNHNAPGGSREPYPYLLFILEFWDNLPNVLIFTQDDCVHKTCPWMIAAPRSIGMLQDWRRHWGEPLAPTRYNCMCRYMVEHNYDRRYFWYNWMSTLQEHIFNHTMATRPQGKTLLWPQDANFAVGAATVRAAPRWFYELLLKLHVSEKWCNGGSIQWAHTIERMWFEIFDPNVPKTKTWLSARAPLTTKQNCLATALEGDSKRGP